MNFLITGKYFFQKTNKKIKINWKKYKKNVKQEGMGGEGRKEETGE